jgi:hypothetical protein
MDDDMKPLSYYTVCDNGEILIEEVDPAEAARQAAAEEKAKRDKIAEQEAHGETLRKAQQQAVAADRRAVTVVSAASGGAGKRVATGGASSSASTSFASDPDAI